MPDGSRVVFSSGRDGVLNIYEKDSGGVGTETPLLKSDLLKRPYSFSSDGRLLLYGVEDPKTGEDLWVLPLDGDRKPMPFVHTSARETHGQFAPVPKGAPAGAQRWVAYSSDETGASEIYVQPYPGGPSAPGGKSPVSKRGGTQPRWGPEGKEIFYRSPEGTLMAVDVKTAPR